MFSDTGELFPAKARIFYTSLLQSVSCVHYCDGLPCYIVILKERAPQNKVKQGILMHYVLKIMANLKFLQYIC